MLCAQIGYMHLLGHPTTHKPALIPRFAPGRPVTRFAKAACTASTNCGTLTSCCAGYEAHTLCRAMHICFPPTRATHPSTHRGVLTRSQHALQQVMGAPQATQAAYSLAYYVRHPCCRSMLSRITAHTLSIIGGELLPSSHTLAVASCHSTPTTHSTIGQLQAASSLLAVILMYPQPA